MKKIEDPFIIEKYYNELNMQEIFINDVTKHYFLFKERRRYLKHCQMEEIYFLHFTIQLE